MEETTHERLARILRQDAEDHARMARGASWEYQAIVQTALLDAAELLYQLKVKDERIAELEADLKDSQRIGEVWRRRHDKKFDRIAVLEAFVRAYDKWMGSASATYLSSSQSLELTKARERVGKVGRK